jgi:hypothetical protein
MRDPEPANIDGEKVQKHVFKHEINWGYVAIAVAVVAVAWRASQLASEGKDEGDSENTRR